MITSVRTKSSLAFVQCFLGAMLFVLGLVIFLDLAFFTMFIELAALILAILAGTGFFLWYWGIRRAPEEGDIGEQITTATVTGAVFSTVGIVAVLIPGLKTAAYVVGVGTLVWAFYSWLPTIHLVKPEKGHTHGPG